MPYSVREKRSYGCSGYPVINDVDSSIAGCYESLPEAIAHQALFAHEEMAQPNDLGEES
jgi:hypothetical protein